MDLRAKRLDILFTDPGKLQPGQVLELPVFEEVRCYVSLIGMLIGRRIK